MNTGFKDKNGFSIPDHSILYGKIEGKYHFFGVYLRSDTGIDMISCTYGYVHIEPNANKELLDYLLIGSIKEHKHLLECD